MQQPPQDWQQPAQPQKPTPAWQQPQQAPPTWQQPFQPAQPTQQPISPQQPQQAPPTWQQPQQPAQQGWQQPMQPMQPPQPIQPQQAPQDWQQPAQPQQPAQQYGAPPTGYQAPVGQQPGFGQVYTPGYGPGVAPAKKAPIGLIVAIAGGIGALLLIIIVAVVLLAGHANSGSITFSPSTISCGTSTVFSETIRLPSSVHAGDVVTVYGDGVEENTVSIDATTWAKQSDGSWLYTFSTTNSLTCASTGTSAVGSHTMTIKDSAGKTLAEGSYTVNP
jgi:hypothetical protein